MKKLFALLLAVMMLFCLCACGNDADTDRDKDRDDDKGGTTTTTVAVKDTLTAKTLEGTWELRMDIGTLMTSGAVDTADMPEMMDMMDFDEMDLKIEMDVTFKNGKLSFDPAGIANFYKDMINAMLDWFAEGDNIYEFMAQVSGEMTAEQYKAAMEAQGMTKDALIDAIKSQMPDPDSAMGDVEAMDDVYYELDGDKLYTWDLDAEKSENEYFQFTYEDETITVQKVVDEGETTNLTDGTFVFKKK